MSHLRDDRAALLRLVAPPPQQNPWYERRSIRTVLAALSLIGLGSMLYSIVNRFSTEVFSH